MTFSLTLHPAVTTSWVVVLILLAVTAISFVAAVFTMDTGPDWIAGFAFTMRALLIPAVGVAVLLTIGQLIFWEAP